jgi:hypothetical protein
VNILVDTSIWSLVLRRPVVDPQARGVRTLYGCLGRGDHPHVVGAIIQELLSGIRSEEQFGAVSDGLAALPLVVPNRETYSDAARLYNACQRKGVQAGQTDCLIAVACIENDLPLLTVDDDFSRIARCCALRLLPVD